MSEVIQQKDKAIFDAIDEGLDKANRQATSNAQTVKKWRLLECDFSIPGGELGEYLIAFSARENIIRRLLYQIVCTVLFCMVFL